jgi:uncharacterized membrane protein
MSSDGTGDTSHLRSARSHLRQVLISGTAIVVPILLTVFVLLYAIDLLSGLLGPIADVVGFLGPGIEDQDLVKRAVAFVVVLATILLVGAISESPIGGNRLSNGVDATMSRLPGISSIYGPLDRMSEMLLEQDTDSFKEVVLVEYPEAGSYSVAFKTAEPPERIREAAEVGADDMITVFMPMGPNPFMGGFIMHLSTDEVYELDLSVEEGISSIVSFGVAVEIDEHPADVPIDFEDIGTE